MPLTTHINAHTLLVVPLPFLSLHFAPLRTVQFSTARIYYMCTACYKIPTNIVWRGAHTNWLFNVFLLLALLHLLQPYSLWDYGNVSYFHIISIYKSSLSMCLRRLCECLWVRIWCFIICILAINGYVCVCVCAPVVNIKLTTLNYNGSFTSIVYSSIWKCSIKHSTEFGK